MIHFTSSFAAIAAATKQYNANRPPKEQLKTTRHVALLQALVKMTARHRQGIRLMQQATYTPLQTNNKALAAVMGCHFNTIKNWRKRLEDAGLMTVTWRGSKADYEVEVAPHLLGEGIVSDPAHEIRALALQKGQDDTWNEAIALALERASQKTLRDKNCAVTGAGTQTKTINTPVEKWKTSTTGNSSANSQVTQDTLQDTKETSKAHSVTHLERDKPSVRPGNTLSRPDLVQLIAEVDGLWGFCERHFYHKLPYLSNSQRITGQAYFLEQFSHTPRDQWKLVRLHLITRLYIVKDYLNQDTNRYVPLPSKWFAPENSKGFSRTKHWAAKMISKTEELKRNRERYELDNRIYNGYRRAVGHYTADPNSMDRYKEAIRRIKGLPPGLEQEFQRVVADIQSGKLKVA